MVLRDRTSDRRYRIGRRVASRPNAEVYEAIAVDDERRRAIKRLVGRDDEEFHQLALREAAVTATLDHPNIVEVVDVGQNATDFFLVMDFVDGPSLGEFLDAMRALKRRVPVEVVCGVVGQIARGLTHAHERALPDGTPLGIVHRDVSADSIMIGADGVPKLIDFGGATLAGHGLTRPGVIRGRPAALSPEQALGRPVDKRTDVFGLGALMFELLAGEPLYSDKDPVQLLRKVSSGAFDPIGPRLKNVDADLVAIIEQCTKKEPEARPHSARDVERKLDRFRAARQLRVDTRMLAKLVEEIEPALAERRRENEKDERGELEGGELVLPAEKGAFESHDGSRPQAEISLGESKRSKPSRHPGPSKAEVSTSEVATAPVDVTEDVPRASDKPTTPPTDAVLKKLILLCAFLLVLVAVLALMLLTR